MDDRSRSTAAYRANHAGRDAYRRRSAVDFRGVTAIRTVKRPRLSPRPARIGDRLKVLSSASQTKPSR